MSKQYKKLYSFGCSFTEGGGLNNQNFHRYLNGETNYSKNPEPVLPNHAEYALQNSYPGYLSRLLNCQFENHGTSCAGNEFIINKAYDTINNLENTDDILVTIQTSILSRILLQMPMERKFVNVNNLDSIDGNVKTFFKLYITDFFDYEYASKKLMQQIDILSSWFESKNIDVLWLLYDVDFKQVQSKKQIVPFDDLALGNYAFKNKLTITELPNFPYKDAHFSPTGNKHIADKIHNYITRI
jgi:hypothetical protein